MPDALDIPCRGCGYDLRGLDQDGNCPECGTPVGRSIAGDRLACADPRWLESIVAGQHMLTLGCVWAVIGLLSSVALVAVVVLALRVTWINLGEGAVQAARMVVILGGVVAGIAIAVLGCFRLTAPDPRDRDREAAIAPRALARWSMVAAIALIVAGEAAALASGSMQSASSMLTFLGFAALGAALVALLFWIEALARRIPDPTLAGDARRAARFFRWSLPVILLAGLASTLAPAAGGLNPLRHVLGCTGGLLTIVAIGYALDLVRTMRRFKTALRTVADEARRQGTEPPAP